LPNGTTTMNAKISVTMDAELAQLVDSLPGDSRSDKLELVVVHYRRAWREAQLRRELAAFASEDGEAESRDWHRIMLEAMWRP